LACDSSVPIVDWKPAVAGVPEHGGYYYGTFPTEIGSEITQFKNEKEILL
jgi:hypothetical protein